MRRYALRDDQWERIRDLLPGREGYVGVTAKDNRLFVEAVLHRYRAGIPWRDLPERFGAWKKVHTRFCRWARGGVWERVFRHLAGEADNEYAMIDSTVVRAHQHSAGAPRKKPGSRGCWLEGRELDGVAEVGEPADEPPGLNFPGTPVEVVGAEVPVGGAVLEHVVGRGQDRGRHRARRLSGAAAGAQAVVPGLQVARLL